MKILSVIGRQGDILVLRVSGSVPKSEPIKRERDGYTIAHGEATGHRHRIPSRTAKLSRDDKGTTYMELVGAATRLLHEEHAPVTIKPENGTTIVFRRQREYSPEEIRVVAD